MVDEIGNSKLIITDGNIRLNLFDIGFCDWVPQTAPWKDGGVFSSSPFSDKTALIARQFTSTADSFTLEPSAFSQDAVIKQLLDLQKFLEKAIAYQTSRWQNEPVWMEACGEQETNKRYALITAYQMPQLDNPFQTPFSTVDVENVAIEDFTLVINHEIWQSEPPGESHCVLGNSIQLQDALYSTTLTEIPVASVTDNICYSKSNENKLFPPILNHITIGFYGERKNNIFVFRGVDLNHFDKIVSAHIDLMCSAGSAAGDELVRITGLKNRGGYVIASTSMPGIYTAEEISRLPRTNAYVDVTIGGPWVAGNNYQVNGLAPIIQEIVNDPDWDYHDDICLVMEDNGTAAGVDEKSAYAIGMLGPMTPGTLPPQLHIGYFSENCPMGQEDTCEDHVFLTNMQSRVQLTDIIVYDAISDPPYPPQWQNWEVCLDPLPHPLFPDIPGVGDQLYVGCVTGDYQSGPFSNIIFDLEFPYSFLPTNITGMTYKYYDKVASAWVVLPVNTYYDETQMFNLAGVHGFFFMQPPNMWHTIIDGKDGYYIQFEITAIAGSISRMAQQANRPVYAPNTAYFDIAETAAGGDIPAIAKTKVHVRNLATLSVYQSFYLAVRSMARGIDFSPYLNCTDIPYQIPGLTCAAMSAKSSLIADTPGLFVGSPTGHFGLYDPAGVRLFNQEFTWTFDDTLAAQYSGKFAFYLRFRNTSATVPDFDVKLKFNWGGMVGVFTDVVPVSAVQTDSLYLGTYDLTLSNKKSERFNIYDISLYIDAAAGAGTLMIFDLVLVPVDEIPILVKVATPGWYAPYAHPEKQGTVIDSVDYPKDLVRVFFFNPANDDLSAALEYYLSGIWMQQTGHQRIWFFGFGGGNMTTLHSTISMQQFATNRYALGMRGNG